MKTITKLLFAGIILSILTSCSSVYYQVYETTPGPQIQKEEKALTYEDQNCRLTYNLWSEGGDIGFKFYNKTDKTLYVNTGQSFFVLNNIAHDYYKNRIFSNASKSISTGSTTLSGLGYFSLFLSSTSSASTYRGNAVSYQEEKIVAIPPKTAKFFSEYFINQALYRDCNLLKYPKKKNINPEHFSRQNSPFVFSNRLVYHLGKMGDLIRFENKFYVSKITNYPEKAITSYKANEFCGEQGYEDQAVIKGSAPDKFYVKYNKKEDRSNFSH